MLKKRIIPTLLLKKGRMVKGRQFKDFKDTGDPVSAARIYNAQKADELVFIDIEASTNDRGLLFSIVEKVAEECFMPFTVGGGIKNLHDIKTMLRVGADKVLINTAALENPSLISSAADTFGNQCIVAGIDVRRKENNWQIYTHGGQKNSRFALSEYLKILQNRGAGEILVNSIDFDGMMSGYDLDLLRLVRSQTDCPIIALGGAGNFQHLAEVLSTELADAVACASLFHFGDNNPIRARAFLKNKGIAVKNI